MNPFNTNPLPQKEQKSGKTTGIVLLAAGRGTRLRRSAGFAVDMPKAFISLGNQTILQHSVKSLEGLVGELILVVVCPGGVDGESWQKQAQKQIEDMGVLQSHFRRRLKEIVYISGGETRAESASLGLCALVPFEVDVVVVHDAARAFAPSWVGADAQEIVISGKATAVVPVLGVSDTLRTKDTNFAPVEIDRNRVVLCQTPQAFDFAGLFAAYKSLEQDGGGVFDDAGVYEKMGGKVQFICGSAHSFKITTDEDLQQARLQAAGALHLAKIETQKGQKGQDGMLFTATAADFHAFGTSLGCQLAGIYFEDVPSLQGHSDGDAAVHAIVDAMLLATGLGDMGCVFGVDRAENAGRDSCCFLQEARELLLNKGFVPHSAHVQIIANAPKIAEKRLTAENILSSAFGAPVHIGATTTDGLGFAGRGEGVCALATVSVKRIF